MNVCVQRWAEGGLNPVFVNPLHTSEGFGKGFKPMDSRVDTLFTLLYEFEL